MTAIGYINKVVARKQFVELIRTVVIGVSAGDLNITAVEYAVVIAV